MKISRAIVLLGAAGLLTACEVAVVERHPTVRRRYITYTDREPYYRVYYRDGDRTYYRRVYYDDDPAIRTRIDTRRYYYRRPVDSTYGF